MRTGYHVTTMLPWQHDSVGAGMLPGMLPCCHGGTTLYIYTLYSCWYILRQVRGGRGAA